MRLHLISGFLGSGKTTAIQQACSKLIAAGKSIGVITNDQGARLVDGDFFAHLNIPERQVPSGCFCCNYEDLDRCIESLITENHPDIIFAESVGSCTDMVATVMKPLLRFRPSAKITLSTFADIQLLKMLLEDSPVFDESVRYIYFKQLEEANTIVISKIDLVNHETLEEVRLLMSEKYGDKILLFQNSFDAENIQQWIDILSQQNIERPSSLQINYDVYGEGEAMLAWYDQELEIFCNKGQSMESTLDLVEKIYEKTLLLKYPIGHLKFLLNGETKINFTATSATDLANIKTQNVAFSTLLINARVQTSPILLSKLISEVITEAEVEHGIEIKVKSTASFQPGYPKPTHRIAD